MEEESMTRKSLSLVAILLAGTAAGVGAGEASATNAPPTWLYQCYSLNGSSTCDLCSLETCLGPDYLCCGPGEAAQ
jgi:hypothetical protein